MLLQLWTVVLVLHFGSVQGTCSVAMSFFPFAVVFPAGGGSVTINPPKLATSSSSYTFCVESPLTATPSTWNSGSSGTVTLASNGFIGLSYLDVTLTDSNGCAANSKVKVYVPPSSTTPGKVKATSRPCANAGTPTSISTNSIPATSTLSFVLQISSCPTGFSLENGICTAQPVPLTHSNLYCWYDAMDMDGDNIDDAAPSANTDLSSTSWNDKSGNNRHLTTTPSGTITLEPNIFGSKQAVRFHGTRGYQGAFTLPQDDFFSVFAVIKLTGADSNYYIVDWGGKRLTGEKRGLRLLTGGPDLTFNGIGRDLAPNQIGAMGSLTIFPTGTSGMVGMIGSAAGPLTSNALTCSLWRDGVIKYTGTPHAGGVLAAYSDNYAVFNIGGRNLFGVNSYDANDPLEQEFIGEIAEVIVYNRALDNTEAGTIWAYLSNKWGVTNSASP